MLLSVAQELTGSIFLETYLFVLLTHTGAVFDLVEPAIPDGAAAPR